MYKKFDKNTLPPSTKKEDFECFGPPALKDGEFEGAMIADLGCFNQDGKDSNKGYHGCICRHKTSGVYYAYFEWGRTGQSVWSFQFHECESKDKAHKIFIAQLKKKNISRGIFKDIGNRKVLCGKPGKDCYRVRPAAKRDTGLPDAKNIVHKDTDEIADTTDVVATKITKKTASKKTTKKKAAKKKTVKKKPRFDKQTIDMLHAMNQGAVNYTRANIEGGHIPTQDAIDEVRDLLDAAQQRVGTVGDNADDQRSDSDLVEITSAIYSVVPKVKKVGDTNWILGSGNITTWRHDIDAYENALHAINIGDDESHVIADPFPGVKIEMKHIDKTTREGAFLDKWFPQATGNRHSHVGRMRIKNMWAMREATSGDRFDKRLSKLKKADVKGRLARPDFQPSGRDDLDDKIAKLYDWTNTAALFHGTRSVNVPGILREGLRLPKSLVGVVITGAMFGPGSYFADDWKKSDGYTSNPRSYWAGGNGHVTGRGAFMFVADVMLGKPFVAPGPRGYTSPPNGHHSIAGLKRQSGVANNEFIVHDMSQVNLRYLVEYETT